MFTEADYREKSDPEIRAMPEAELQRYVHDGQLDMDAKAQEIRDLTGIGTGMATETALAIPLEDWRWLEMIADDPGYSGRLEVARHLQARAAVILAAVNTAKVRLMEINHEREAAEYDRP
jgi:hypothetical protein